MSNVKKKKDIRTLQAEYILNTMETANWSKLDYLSKAEVDEIVKENIECIPKPTNLEELLDISNEFGLFNDFGLRGLRIKKSNVYKSNHEGAGDTTLGLGLPRKK